MAGRKNQGQCRTNQKAIDVVEKRVKALEYRKGGLSFRVIAERVGYKDASGAYRAVKAALLDTLQEPADELRQMECARLDQLISAMWPQAIKGSTWHVDRVLSIMERRSRLLGLDAPVKREITMNQSLEGLARIAAEGTDLDPKVIVAEAERIMREASE
jgi:hypothetical protein